MTWECIGYSIAFSRKWLHGMMMEWYGKNQKMPRFGGSGSEQPGPECR